MGFETGPVPNFRGDPADLVREWKAAARDVRQLAIKHARTKRSSRISGYRRTGHLARNIEVSDLMYEENSELTMDFSFEVGVSESKVDYIDYVVDGTGIYGPKKRPVELVTGKSRETGRKITKIMIMNLGSGKPRSPWKRVPGAVFMTKHQGRERNDFLNETLDDPQLGEVISRAVTRALSAKGKKG